MNITVVHVGRHPQTIRFGVARAVSRLYLNRYYAAGRFLASGRKVPREGGFILTTCESRDQVEAIVKEDPFVVRGLADCRIIEFQISQRAPSIDAALAQTAKLR